ncbi:MAG: ribokinase [Planctomycetaceae bacterium]|nr:ribokinase [Planctomycetaceae bacterium]
MASSVIVLGSINTDLVVRGNRLPRPGETVLGDEFFQAAGGKGANQAVAAARLATDPVTFIGAIGDDELGRQALSGLARENMTTDYIKVASSQASGVALIMVDAVGENCISVAPGANHCFLPEDVERVPDEAFAKASVFLACLESPLPTVAAGLRRAKAFGLTTILNPGPASAELVAHEMLADVDVITPNSAEASALSDVVVADRASATAAARQLQQRSALKVIVTLGSAGAMVIEDDSHFVPAVAADSIDTTAAGDAFNGALAVALAEGRSLKQAARMAAIVAGASVSRRGAQPSLPARHELPGSWQAVSG